MKLRQKLLVLLVLSTALTACHAGSKQTKPSDAASPAVAAQGETSSKPTEPTLAQKEASAQDKKTLVASLFKATKFVYPKLDVMTYEQPWAVSNLNFENYFTPDLIEPMKKAQTAVLNTTYGYCDKDVLGGQEVGESLTIFEPDADGNVQAATYYAKGLELYTPILFVFEGNKIKDIRRVDDEAKANYQTQQIKPIDVKLFSKETLKEKIARSEACFKLPEPR